MGRTMLNKEECLKIIANHRTDEIVITTMGAVAAWGEISDHPLDFASVGSAMGHAADFALGIALAKPEKKVLVLNGDGSMLMSLGTLATATGLTRLPHNYYLFVCENSAYEVTGNQLIPGGTNFSFTTVARGSGFDKIYRFDQPSVLDSTLPVILDKKGPTFVNLKIASSNAQPPHRSSANVVRYLRETLSESTHKLAKALQS